MGRVCSSSCSTTLIFYKRLVSRVLTSWYGREQEASKMSKHSIYLRFYCGLVADAFRGGWTARHCSCTKRHGFDAYSRR